MDEEILLYETDAVEPLKDTKNDLRPENEVVNYVLERFHRAEDKKRSDEPRLLMAYRNFRGEYGPDVVFSDAEKSRVFVKVTKTKVLAAYGQTIEVLFGNQSFPITVDNTILPEGIVEDVSFDPAAPPMPTPPIS